MNNQQRTAPNGGLYETSLELFSPANSQILLFLEDIGRMVAEIQIWKTMSQPGKSGSNRHRPGERPTTG
jgi:hypothetical protein